MIRADATIWKGWTKSPVPSKSSSGTAGSCSFTTAAAFFPFAFFSFFGPLGTDASAPLVAVTAGEAAAIPPPSGGNSRTSSSSNAGSSPSSASATPPSVTGCHSSSSGSTAFPLPFLAVEAPLVVASGASSRTCSSSSHSSQSAIPRLYGSAIASFQAGKR